MLDEYVSYQIMNRALPCYLDSKKCNQENNGHWTPNQKLCKIRKLLKLLLRMHFLLFSSFEWNVSVDIKKCLVTTVHRCLVLSAIVI